MNPSRIRVAAATTLSSLLLVGCFGNSPEQYLAAAQRALDKGDRETAVIELKNALQAAPQMGEARFLLARTLHDSGDINGSTIELGKAEETGYGGDAVIPLRAKLLLARNQEAKLISDYAQKQLASPAEMADLQTSLAMAYAQSGRISDAMDRVDRSLKLVPDNLRAQMVKIRLMIADKRAGDASAAMDALLAKHDKDSEVWRLKGDLLVSTDQRGEAVKAYRQAADLNPKDIASRGGAFTLLMEAKDQAGAEAELKRLKEAAPKHPQTFFYMAVMAYERNDLKTALEDIQRVLKVAPTDPRVLLLAGRIEFRRGALLEAESHLSKIVSANPGNDGVRAMLARTQLRQGDVDKALLTLQPALANPDKNPVSVEAAAEAYMQAGDHKRAETYFAMVAKANPKDVRSRVALAMGEARQGPFDKGVASLRALAASDPGMTANFGLINLHMERNQFAQALAAIDELQRKAPAAPLPAQLRGRVEQTRGDSAKAREAFEAALKLDAAYYPAIAALANLDVESKDYKAAAARYQKVLDASPKHLQANMGLVAVREQAGAKPAELATMLEKVVQQVPTEAAPRLALVNLYLKSEDRKQALDAAQTAAATLPNNPDVQAALGRARAAVGDFDQAVAAYNKQIALSPGSPQPYLSLAELYTNRKDRASAVRSLKRALSIKPDYLPAQIALVAASLSSGNFAEARSVAQTVRQQRPNDAVGLMLQGDIEYTQKRWDLAAASYRSALAALPTRDIALKLHRALLQTGNGAAAKAFETEWMAAHPDDLGFRFYLGDRAMALKDYAQSEQHFQAILKAQPDNAPALNNLAWLFMQTDRPEALDYAARANQSLPNRPSLMDTLAQAHAKAKQFDKAIEIEKKVVSLAPDNKDYRLTLARLYIGAGQKDAARQELTRLAELGDESAQQQEAKQLLGTL